MQAFLYAKRLAHIINLRPVPLSFNIPQKLYRRYRCPYRYIRMRGLGLLIIRFDTPDVSDLGTITRLKVILGLRKTRFFPSSSYPQRFQHLVA